LQPQHSAPPPSHSLPPPPPLSPDPQTDQRTFLHLLADYDSPGGSADLLRVVDECGGVRHVIHRFFRHYDVGHPPGGHHRGAAAFATISFNPEQSKFVSCPQTIPPNPSSSSPLLLHPSHPQGYSSITLLEQGFNFDYTKALLRLLRNRGVLAALPVAEKEQLAAWLTGRQLYGSATYFFQVTGLRR
jgi:hypothetical protein